MTISELPSLLEKKSKNVWKFLTRPRKTTAYGHTFRLEWRDGIGRNLESYAPEIAKEILSLDERDVLFDVGANIGYFSYLGTMRGAEVHSFEPHPFSYALLDKNVPLARKYQWAMSDSIKTYHYYDYGGASSPFKRSSYAPLIEAP